MLSGRYKYIILAITICAFLSGGYSEVKKYLSERELQKKQREILAQVRPVFGNLPSLQVSYVNDSKDTPKTVGVDQNLSDTNTPQNPSVSKVFSYKKDQSLTLENATRIATILGISGQSQKQEDESYIFYSDDKSAALTFWEKDSQINYYNKGVDFSKTPPTLENAANAASYYFSQFNLDGFKMVPDKDGSKYEIRNGKEYPEMATIESHDSVFIPFIREDLDYKAVSFPYQEYLLYFSIGPENKILNMSLYYAPLNEKGYGVYQIKPLEFAKEEATQNKGLVVNLGLPESYYFDADAKAPKISSIYVTGWHLAYLDRRGLDYLQPVYVFTGTASLDVGISAPVTLYVNAIK
jgi:hypothetical protein